MTIPRQAKDAYPLSWPDDWPRTRIQDQRTMPSWKGTANKYRDALIVELERMKSPSSVITSNVPLTLRGQMTVGVEPRDTGVAVYFSRPAKEDYTWSDVLGIRNPIQATEGEVQAAFKRLAALYHPDRGGDMAMFQKVTEARNQALNWLNRTSAKYDYVIACDAFKEVRLNMCAIVQTIRAIRSIERAGTSSLLERAFKGFSALPEQAGASGTGGVR